MISSILREAWRIYREKFGIITAVVVAVWLPCELLSSYFDTFIFDPDDLCKSFRFAQFLENFFGIIATSGVIFISLQAGSGQETGFSTALGAGFRNWGGACGGHVFFAASCWSSLFCC